MTLEETSAMIAECKEVATVLSDLGETRMAASVNRLIREYVKELGGGPLPTRTPGLADRLRAASNG